MSRGPLGLFDGPAPRVRATPASAPFLDVLADAMVDALDPAKNAFALADALVLLPNQRAARGLIDAFAQRLGGAALLPAIRPLGDLGEEVEVWGADPIALDVAPAIEPMRQAMELAALVRARDRAEGGAEDPARALALADELRKLLESAAVAERVRWEALPNLVEEIDLARHWEASAKFLDIIATYWPQRLAADGLSDPGARRSALLYALAREWSENPPTRPIIIAGSTGSFAATRAVMAAAARLPRGVVVLPGLDGGLDEESWAAIGDQHPQFALKHTLAALGLERGAVPELGAESASGRARRGLIREALTPAERTADWLVRLNLAGGAEFVRAGIDGVRLIEAETEEAEAGAVALLLREALEQNRSAAMVTPDARLARRVEAKLARWGVAPSVSHALPLRECEAGMFIALLCELARDAGEPVALAALLKHPRVALGADARARAALEHEMLRGPRCYETLAELAAHEKLAKFPRAKALVEALAAALAPLTRAMAQEALTLAAFADAVTQVGEKLAGAAAWAGRDGEKAAQVLREAIAHGDELGPMPAYAAPRVLMELVGQQEVSPQAGGDPRVAIWGPLEARLQRRDLMILSGLNEGVWPAPAPEDPFLSRAMRDKLGLPSHDQRIGLAAHDFAQLIAAPDVVLTRALRREGAPTLASRWLWRLKTLVQGAQAKIPGAPQALAWAQALDAPAAPRPAKAPRPKPPADGRLKRISVTQVETLIRDPYAVYAQRILGLRVLDPIGKGASHRERGNAVHKAIERFEDGEDRALLLALLDEELHRHGVAPERRMAERERLIASADVLLEWFKSRRGLAEEIYRECKGVLDVAGVELSGIADRIELGPAHAAILDFKTGKPPTEKQVTNFAPQLLLEAAMLARGVFKQKVGEEERPIAAAKAREILYWWFGGGEPTPKPLNLDPLSEGESALANLEALLKAYAKPAQEFLSKPRVEFLKSHTGRIYTDYDHLARRKEWADAEGDGE